MALLPRAMSQNASLSIVEEKEVGGSLVLLTDREHIHATFQGRNKDEIVFSMGSKLEKILLTCIPNDFGSWWLPCLKELLSVLLNMLCLFWKAQFGLHISCSVTSLLLYARYWSLEKGRDELVRLLWYILYLCLEVAFQNQVSQHQKKANQTAHSPKKAFQNPPSEGIFKKWIKK